MLVQIGKNQFIPCSVSIITNTNWITGVCDIKNFQYVNDRLS